MSLQTHRLQPSRAGYIPGIRSAALLTALALTAWAGAPTPARAAGTGTTALFMPQGVCAEVQFGDFITSNEGNGGGCVAPCTQTIGLNTIYRYFVEVPAGLSRLRLQIFDADIGGFGTGEGVLQRDRTKGTSYSTFATYSLLNPAGTKVASWTCPPGLNQTAPLFCIDDTWTSLLDVNSVATHANNFVLDTFSARLYTNQNGNVNWSTNWTETNDDGSPTTGLIQVTNPAGQLQISDNADGNPSAIQRGVLLGTGGLGFTNAILTFSFTTSAPTSATDSMNLDASPTDGATFSRLQTIPGPLPSTQFRNYNITSSISNTLNTVIRFRRNVGYNGHNFLVSNVQIQNVSPDAGHWELDVDMSSAVNTTACPAPGGTTNLENDINAFGIRADEGSQPAATELPIYYSAHSQVGQNTTGGADSTKNYNFYPYVTSGCNLQENDFDYDLNNGSTTVGSGVGTLDFTSRSGAFTHNLAATALSQNDVWNTNTVTGYTTDSDATDYGIWALAATISNYDTNNGTTQNGNYANIEIANSSSTACTGAGQQGCAPANNAPTANTLRVYLPTDAGSAPVKPYMEQEERYLGGSSGPHPPVVGQTNTVVIPVQVANPTAHAITFSAPNLVTVNVPGAGAVYVDPSATAT